MKKIVLFLVLACVVLAVASTELVKHPQAVEIQQYLDRNPIDSRLSELLNAITKKSMDLNKQGFQAYTAKRYEAALKKEGNNDTRAIIRALADGRGEEGNK